MASRTVISKDNQIKVAKSAQRPMNAFLIFCKRERGSVRQKYPFLENREVTRVLGEWWASLRPADKSLYSALANQHKENFVKSTKPVFTWRKFKMPAGRGKKLPPTSSQPAIIPGKLADESQLGGLSSLLIPKDVVVREEVKAPLPIPLKKRYRDEIYTSQVEEVQKPLPAVEKPKEEKTDNLVDSTEADNLVDSTEADNLVDTTEANEGEERLKMWRSHILEENNNVKDTRTRACKGQRYREFMWTNYSTRRKSNRWELNQDKNEPHIPMKKIKTAKVKTNSDKPLSKISNSVNKADIHKEIMENGPLSKTEKKRSTKDEVGDSSDSNNVVDGEKSLTTVHCNIVRENRNPDSPPQSTESCEQMSCDNTGSDKKPEVKTTLPPSTNERPKQPEVVVGSRKRKIRRQEIRRLTPGTTFNDILV